jgi:hypothetical protein
MDCSEDTFLKCLSYCGDSHVDRFYGAREQPKVQEAAAPPEDAGGNEGGGNGKKRESGDGTSESDSDSSDNSSDSSDESSWEKEEEEEAEERDIDNCNLTDEEKELLRKHFNWMRKFIRNKCREERWEDVDRNVEFRHIKALEDWIVHDPDPPRRDPPRVALIPRDDESMGKFCRMVADLYCSKIPTTLRERVTLCSRKDVKDPHWSKPFRFFVELEMQGLALNNVDQIFDLMTHDSKQGPLVHIVQHLHKLFPDVKLDEEGFDALFEKDENADLMDTSHLECYILGCKWTEFDKDAGGEER